VVAPVQPYRTAESATDGTVVVLVDIDALVRARNYAERIIATVRTPLVVLDEQFMVVTANEAFYRTFRTTPAGTERQSFFELPAPRRSFEALRRPLLDAATDRGPVSDVDVTTTDDSGEPRAGS